MVDGAAVSHMCRCVAAIFVGSAFDVFVWSFWGAFVHIRTSCSVQECTMLVSVVECAFLNFSVRWRGLAVFGVVRELREDCLHLSTICKSNIEGTH